MSRRVDAAYYAELEAGAVYLADNASEPADRAEHLKMAGIYGQRARAADAPGAHGSVH